MFTGKPMIHREVPSKSALIQYGLNYILSTEQLVVTNAVENFVKCVNILQKQVLLSYHSGDPKIKHCFDCDDKCLVYLFTCNNCRKQWTGQTSDHFCSGWNNLKSKRTSFDRGEQRMQEHLYKHFECESHLGFRDEIPVILINKTDGSNPTKRETYWMQTLKTIAPYCLNVENSV